MARSVSASSPPMPTSASSPVDCAQRRGSRAGACSIRRGIDTGGLVVLVHQRLEVAHRPVAFGAGQRRGQVIDDHRLRPALGLRALARVVDDERVEMRHRPERRFGQAGLGQRQRLARQPFEIAVLAHVHDRLGTVDVPQPDIEGEVVVRRHEVGGMVGVGRVDVVAARRLQADDHVAIGQNRKLEPAAIDLARFVERVGLRRRPSVRSRRRARRPEAGPRRSGSRPCDKRNPAFPVGPVGEPVGRAGHDRVHQGVGILSAGCRPGSPRLPAGAGHGPWQRAYRGRRRWRAGRPCWGSSRAPARPGARAMGVCRNRAQLTARSATNATRSTRAR